MESTTPHPDDGPHLVLITEEFLESCEEGPELSYISFQTISTRSRKRNRGRKCRGYKKLRGRITHKFCLVCGVTDKLTVDHIVPRANGGAVKAKENLMFLCEKCNSHKSDKMPADWLRTITPKTVKNFCSERFEILVQAIDIAIEYHCQKMSKPSTT